MTIRHKVHATVLIAALTFGCVTVSAATVSAAPTTSAAQPAYAIAGNDALAGYANSALEYFAQYAMTGSKPALAQFDSIRDAVAAEAANRLGLNTIAMQEAWRAADDAHQTALMAAFTQLGTRYKAYAATPGVGFDCSGLTSWAWGQAGVSLFHQSRTQINNSLAVTRDTAQAGDLVYYPGHVMLYLGVDNAIIHAPSSGRTVEVGFVAKRRANSVRFGDPTVND